MRLKPKLVVICFFPAFSPPSSGGEMRLGKLYEAVSDFFDVHMVTSSGFDTRYEEIKHSLNFTEYRFPKDDLWRRAYGTLEASGVTGELSGLAFLLAVSDPKCQLRMASREMAVGAKYVVHEFPYSEPIFSDNCPAEEIFNSHNVEATLLSAIVRGPGFEKVFLRLLRTERNLVRRAARVFATSPDDAQTFHLLYGAKKSKLGVCPNGFSEVELNIVAERRAKLNRSLGRRPSILFTGSGHLPNTEAAKFIVQLARNVPELDIILAGGVCKSVDDESLPSNVYLYGPFSAVEKLDLLVNADIYINPVLLGSGTSLKALECLGAGMPTIATPEGVRGLGLSLDKHAKIVSRADMAQAIRSVLAFPDQAAMMACEGREYALSHFTWSKIASQFASSLGAESGTAIPSKDLILALNDYPALTTRSGGEVRILKLLSNLQCDVVLLTFGSQTQIRMLDNGVLHVAVAKTPNHQALQDYINQGQPVSVNDVVAALFSDSNRSLAELVSLFAQRACAITCEHPYMASALEVAMSVRPDLPIIYSAHNVEAIHKEEILRGHPLATLLVSFVEALERRLTDVADLVVCCSEADALRFAIQHKRVIVVPNGCDIPQRRIVKRTDAMTTPRVGFLGSSHTPNIEAARFVATSLAPQFPEVIFEFVGGVCDALLDLESGNVVLHGGVPNSLKTKIMHGWSLAINPVQSGGGSSLKLPDFMAHGLPTLNTQIGARGFEIENYGAGKVADRSNFGDILRDMLSDQARLAEMGERAFGYAIEFLEWPNITAKYRNELATLAVRPEPSSCSRLLVVTYRYTEPSLGGAEEYLVEVLKRLRPSFDIIDLAAVDITHITNKHHFGCDQSTGPGGAGRLAELFDNSYFFPSEEPPEPELLEHCRSLERAWAREDFDLFRPFVNDLASKDELRLLCGFFGLETHNGVQRRWTAPRFSFLLPYGAVILRLSGWASKEKLLRATLLDIASDGSTSKAIMIENRVGPYAEVNLALPSQVGGIIRVIEIEVDEHTASNDHRPFGMLLDGAYVLLAAESGEEGEIRSLRHCSANFSEEIPDKLRVSHTSQWIASLRNTALRRESSTNAHFAASRGPHAPKMQEWLSEHGGNYDCVLVQGIPFDVIPRSVETLVRLPNRPRIVTLPHFHGDDRFYHWRSYLEAFDTADCSFLFSDFLADALGQRDKFAIVPGGGVQLDEISDLGAETKFRDVHQSDNPFFLILGRKTGTKGYETVMRAHRKLRAFWPKVDLVLIGPDDDGLPVFGEGVHFLGRQPREVVRGALSSCLGLVTMSQSESFGIVLCEAWLFGKPVVANAKCYSFRELVRHGETGLLVDSDEELLRAMNELVNDPDKRIQMGRRGFEIVAEMYRWEKVANEIKKSLSTSVC